MFRHAPTGALLAINCAAISDNLLESELFGHERGAFTGAESQRIGKFEQVDGGTLFLDEIGDMSPAAQAKVLRLLQDGSFERVGSNEPMRADVRIIAATNQDLEAMVEHGRFRRDLFHRMSVFAIQLPSLRDRLDDLPRLVEYFVKVFNRDLGKNVHAVSPKVMDVLQDYHWPGNVRELQGAIKFALVHAIGETITPDCLPHSCAATGSSVASRDDNALPGKIMLQSDESFSVAEFVCTLLESDESDIYRLVHNEIDRILLSEVLDYVEGNQTLASQRLGISRSTLYNRISGLGLSFEKRVRPESGHGDQESNGD